MFTCTANADTIDWRVNGTSPPSNIFQQGATEVLNTDQCLKRSLLLAKGLSLHYTSNIQCFIHNSDFMCYNLSSSATLQVIGECKHACSCE